MLRRFHIDPLMLLFCGMFAAFFVFAAFMVAGAVEQNARMRWEQKNCHWVETGRIVEVTRGGQCINQMSTSGMLGMCVMRAPSRTEAVPETALKCPQRQ